MNKGIVTGLRGRVELHTVKTEMWSKFSKFDEMSQGGLGGPHPKKLKNCIHNFIKFKITIIKDDLVGPSNNGYFGNVYITTLGQK